MEQREELVDVDALLRVRGRLGRLRERVDAADVDAEQLQRWHVRLRAIVRAATEDLGRAERLLDRFAGQVDRRLDDRARGR